MFAEQLTVGETRLIRLRVHGGERPKWLTAIVARDCKDREMAFRRAAARAPYDLVLHGDTDEQLRVQATTDDDLDWLDADGRSVVAYAAYLTDAELGLQCYSFTAADIDEPMEIGVDDAIAEQVRVAAASRTGSFEPLREWLMEEFTLKPALGLRHRRLVHSGGPADNLSVGLTAFTMHGRRWVADVALIDGRLRISRLTDATARNPGRWPRLSALDLRFVDKGEEADATEAMRAALLGLATGGRSYLDLWHAYNEIEREALIEEAKRLKWGVYQACRVLADGAWQFELLPGERNAWFLAAVAAHTGKLELEAAHDLPQELNRQTGRSSAGVNGEVLRAIKANWTLDLTLTGDDPPPATGFLFRSLSGDRTRLRRRDLARERINADQAEISGLRLLIEGMPRPGAHPHIDRKHERAIAAAVRSGSDGHPPTPTQWAALLMALETPDILLVQGPPGTGKTRFITDLLRCLDELGDRALAMNRTLISSFQHEAVDNVARQARRFGLPPTRVSTKRERDLQNIRHWRDETLGLVEDYLKEHRPEDAQHDRLVQLRQLASAYDRQPVTGSDLVALLEEAKRLAGPALPSALRGRLDRILAGLLATAKARTAALPVDERDRLSRAIRSIRVTALAFHDDGPDRADRAAEALDRLLDESGRAVLRRAAVAEGPADGLLTDLAELRSTLLERLADTSAPIDAPTHDPDIDALLHLLVEAMTETGAETSDGVGEVLRRYRNDLQEDLALVEATLARYNSVLASTVQQADSLAMSRVLDAPLPVFDTVIVDEAARANPLDLMIPMAFAKRRIILVGDHKQLPHALEQKVERELRRNRALDGSELSQSLFERWFELFAQDKPAMRTIRLDIQFRMHPILGRFVSEVFYGGPDVIQSHASTRELVHDLRPYAGKVAGWIDVPHGEAGEQRIGLSRGRRVEAERLAAEVVALAALDHDRKLTFGVITFYRAQRELLKAALVDAELGVWNDDGAFQPVPAMAFTVEPRPRQRLWVGTVDAFQGMEFDVVLLSVTRSAPPSRSADDPGEAVRCYGHLLSDSRMCVAMSRQRRLLIAVGDPAMADRSATPEAPDRPGRSVAEGIVAFRELCEGAHGAGIRR